MVEEKEGAQNFGERSGGQSYLNQQNPIQNQQTPILPQANQVQNIPNQNYQNQTPNNFQNIPVVNSPQVLPNSVNQPTVSPINPDEPSNNGNPQPKKMKKLIVLFSIIGIILLIIIGGLFVFLGGESRELENESFENSSSKGAIGQANISDTNKTNLTNLTGPQFNKSYYPPLAKENLSLEISKLDCSLDKVNIEIGVLEGNLTKLTFLVYDTSKEHIFEEKAILSKGDVRNFELSIEGLGLDLTVAEVSVNVGFEEGYSISESMKCPQV